VAADAYAFAWDTPPAAIRRFGRWLQVTDVVDTGLDRVLVADLESPERELSYALRVRPAGIELPPWYAPFPQYTLLSAEPHLRAAHPGAGPLLEVLSTGEHLFAVEAPGVGVTFAQLAAASADATWPLGPALSLLDDLARGIEAVDRVGQERASVEGGDNLRVGLDGRLRMAPLTRHPLPPDGVEVSRLSRTSGYRHGLPWMSPEEIRGDEDPPGQGSWALGVLGFLLATGAHPFMRRGPTLTLAAIASGERPSLDGVRWPRDLVRALELCLAPRADDRIPWHGVRVVLESLLAEDGADRRAVQGTLRGLVPELVARMEDFAEQVLMLDVEAVPDEGATTLARGALHQELRHGR
jgi:hypothetical protein